MPANIEVKARVPVVAILEDRLGALAGEPAANVTQEDVFFAVPKGRLKLRRESNQSGEFIYYQRADESGPKYSAYFRSRPDDLAETEDELRRLFGAKAIVRKTRRLYWVEGARIHLDEVDGLGSFVEIEVPVRDDGEHRARAQAAHLMKLLGIDDEDLVSEAYEDLLTSAQVATNRPAGTARVDRAGLLQNSPR